MTIVWSDESKFNLFHSDGRTYVRRRTSEEFDERCVTGTVKHGGGSVMIWGCISGDDKGMLVRVRGTMNQFQYLDVLENAMIPSAWSMRGLNFRFMHDNAPCHKAKLISNWMREENIQCEEWPPQSPDLNPIENIWDYMETKLEKMPSTTVSELWETLQEIWRSIPSEVILNLVRSMPRRVQAVLKAKGGHTKY